MVTDRLNKEIFWDIDFASINYQENARFVIERVLNYGDLSDWNAIKNIYSLNIIKSEVVKIISLNDKTFNFLSVILNIPKDHFKCYTTKQSTPKLWNY